MTDIEFDADSRCYHTEAGQALYPTRYRAVSAFAEGLAVAHKLDGGVVLIDPLGRELDLRAQRFAWILPPHLGRALAQTIDGRHGWLDRTGGFHAHREDPE